jgi:O-acetyl-ADP-ribose deacetylase (regulator of RNase III)
MDLGKGYATMSDDQKVERWAAHFHFGARMSGDEDHSFYDSFNATNHAAYCAYEPDFDRLLPAIALALRIDLAQVRRCCLPAAERAWAEAGRTPWPWERAPSPARRSLAGRLEIARGDLTREPVDAIVNPTNPRLDGSGGLDAAVHSAGGERLVAELRYMSCPVGEARITTGGDLPARFVLHVAPPLWRGGEAREDELLGRCYRHALLWSELRGFATLGVPSIGTGSNGFPLARAVRIAVTEVRNFLEKSAVVERVRFVCFDENTCAAYRTMATELLADP